MKQYIGTKLIEAEPAYRVRNPGGDYQITTDAREAFTNFAEVEDGYRVETNVRIKLDTDSPENGDLTRQHRIMSVPTFILYREGRVMWRHSGVVSLETLTDIIRRYEKTEAL